MNWRKRTRFILWILDSLSSFFLLSGVPCDFFMSPIFNDISIFYLGWTLLPQSFVFLHRLGCCSSEFIIIFFFSLSLLSLLSLLKLWLFSLLSKWRPIWRMWIKTLLRILSSPVLRCFRINYLIMVHMLWSLPIVHCFSPFWSVFKFITNRLLFSKTPDCLALFHFPKLASVLCVSSFIIMECSPSFFLRLISDS